MQIIADLHTHTNVTDHAFSTLTEMVQAAEDRGLAAIAITNHGPTNPDGPHEWHFSNLDLIPRKIGKVTVIRGIEFDITAPAGGINVISNKSLKPVEFALASFHECMFPPVDSSVHTAAARGHPVQPVCQRVRPPRQLQLPVRPRVHHQPLQRPRQDCRN